MLREYINADIGNAIELYIDNFANAPFNYEWLDKYKIRRYFLDLEKTPGFLSFVYEVDNNIAALCLGVWQNYFVHGVYEIKEFIVSRHSRGCGLGSDFMNAIELSLPDKGIDIVMLSTAKSIQAFEFYKKNNYQVLDDSVWMSKQL